MFEAVLITGDFNYPSIRWNFDSHLNANDASTSNANVGDADLFKSTVDHYFLTQVNINSTRGDNILIPLFTDKSERISNIVAGKPLICTDHSFLQFVFHTTVRSKVKSTRIVYNYRKGNLSALKESVQSLASDIRSIDSAEINNVWNTWKTTLLSKVDQFIPKSNLKSKNSPPWITGEIIHLVKKKASVRSRAKASQSSTQWAKFKDLRSRIKKLILQKRKEYYKSLEASLQFWPKWFWSILSFKTKKQSVPKKVCSSEGPGGETYAKKPRLIADMFNRFFFSIFSNPNESNWSHSLDDIHYHFSRESAKLSEITLNSEDACFVSIEIDCSKAQVPDKIPARILVECAEELSPSLTDLFNLSLSSCSLPTEWKSANIVPLLKKFPVEKVENSRPISLLFLVSKLLERCIFNKIIDHISVNLSNFQHGLGRSTTSQLLAVYHKILENMDAGLQTDAMFFDFSKTFDSVNQHKLLIKLTAFGITGKLHAWFKDYLTNRSQQVTVLGETSDSLPFLSGVPQGSILGPLLFLVYINDIVDAVKERL